MRLLDTQYTATPFYGSRRMTAWLRSQGYAVNRKRVTRLMQQDGDCGHLYEAAAEPGGRGTRDLSVSLARRADRAGQPCVEHRYDVYPLAAGVCLSGGGDRLVQSVRTVLGLIDHAGWRLLPGGTGDGAPRGTPRDLQH